MQDLKVTAVQASLVWEDAQANRRSFAHTLASLKGATDLVVLPEMFTTGFSMNTRELAETMDGPTLGWMQQQAFDLDCAINGSLIIEEDGKYYNRSLFVLPDGSVDHYDKRHLFRMANEDTHFTEGKQRRTVEWKGWRILLQVCYDLRFPVFSRNRQDYDLALYVANWPAARSGAWSTLLKARAIENQCYVVGVNRVGVDGMEIEYCGASAIIDTRGEELLPIPLDQEVATTATLSHKDMQAFRDKFPIHKDADEFQLKV